MRVWDIASAESRAAAFEPDAAEVFAVKGRAQTREYVAAAFDEAFLLFIKSPCDTCAFRAETSKGGRPLCVIGRFVCRADERKDGRQIVVIRR